MTLAFLIYFVSQLQAFSSFAFTMAIITGIGGLFVALIRYLTISPAEYYECEGGDEKKKKTMKIVYSLFAACFIFSSIGTIIPKEKTAWLMLGGYAAQTVYESEDGIKYRKLIIQKIDEDLIEKTK